MTFEKISFCAWRSRHGQRMINALGTRSARAGYDGAWLSPYAATNSVYVILNLQSHTYITCSVIPTRMLVRYGLLHCGHARSIMFFAGSCGALSIKISCLSRFVDPLGVSWYIRVSSGVPGTVFLHSHTNTMLPVAEVVDFLIRDSHMRQNCIFSGCSRARMCAVGCELGAVGRWLSAVGRKRVANE